MSDLIIQATTIQDIKPHSNADKLELVTVYGWQIVVGKGVFKVGDSVIHIPPDAMVPKALGEALDVWKYLGQRPDDTHRRVKAIRLRGEMSYGFIFPNSNNYEEGVSLTEILGIKKYETPEPNRSGGGGQACKRHPLLHTYTDIQNIKYFSRLLEEGETVICTEKIHGTNSIVGLVEDVYKNDGTYEYVISSHKVQRAIEEGSIYELPLNENMKNMLQYCIKHPELLSCTTTTVHSVLVYGEIYGKQVQDLAYGVTGRAYRVFDIAINGEYINYPTMKELCDNFEIDTVPLIYCGPYNKEKIHEITQGKTTLSVREHTREGIVIKPMEERRHPKLGRVILKSISDEYLLRKNGTEFH